MGYGDWIYDHTGNKVKASSYNGVWPFAHIQPTPIQPLDFAGDEITPWYQQINQWNESNMIPPVPVTPVTVGINTHL